MDRASKIRRLEVAVKEFLKDERERGKSPSIRSYANRHGVNRRQLTKQIECGRGLIANGGHWRTFVAVEKKYGNPCYLDEHHKSMLVDVAMALDMRDSPGTPETLRYVMGHLHALQHGKDFTRSEQELPCSRTVANYLKELKIKLKSARKGEQIRTTKSKPEYLIVFYQKLKSICPTAYMPLVLQPSSLYRRPTILHQRGW